MKLYVIVVNEVRYLRFFADHAEAYQYLHFVLPEKLKTEINAFFDNPKAYFRNGNLWLRYENSMTGETERHLYSIEEINLIDILNWLADARENKWIRQYLITETESE